MSNTTFTSRFDIRNSDVEVIKASRKTIEEMVAGAKVADLQLAKANATKLFANGITEEPADLLQAVALFGMFSTAFPQAEEPFNLTPESFENLLIQGIQGIQQKACAVDVISTRKRVKIDSEIRKYLHSLIRVAIRWMRKNGAEVTFEFTADAD